MAEHSEEAAAAAFTELRPLLVAIGYRMLGSVSEAEDLVQEALLRYQRALAEAVVVESPKAYLSAVVTRLAIDQLRSARVRRETYVGQWLPEPVLTDADGGDPAYHAEQADSLSMAFLLLLERLTPVERAVFLLHDVFGYGYQEIASIVDRSEPTCRQLATRARSHLSAGRPRFETSQENRDALAARFFAAVTGSDVDSLVSMLASDAVLYGDGGGKAPQWPEPLTGPDRIAKVLANVGRQIRRFHLRLEFHQVNGGPGALVRTAAGEVVNVFALEVAGGSVRALRSVINPEKLRHLGPVADLDALRDERSRPRSRD